MSIEHYISLHVAVKQRGLAWAGTNIPSALCGIILVESEPEIGRMCKDYAAGLRQEPMTGEVWCRSVRAEVCLSACLCRTGRLF